MPDGYATWAARWRVPLGFALGAAYLIFAQPTFPLLLVGSAVSFPGLLLRAWSAGYLSKNESLTTCGPYAYTRNPLYLGSFILGLGLAVAGGSWILVVTFVAYFVAVYFPVMKREAEFLRGKFGETYAHYAQAVPLFLPRISAARIPSGKFLWERYRRNREYQAALGFLAGLVFLALKTWLR